MTQLPIVFRWQILVLCVFALSLFAFVPAVDPIRAVADETVRVELPAEVVEILAAKCTDCHGSSDPDSRLDLSSLQSLLIGGEGGRTILPGRPAESLLWQKIAEGEMPPEGEPPLSAAEKGTIRDWIESGTILSTEEIEKIEMQRLSDSAHEHWSFRPVREPEVPSTQDSTWPHSNIDRFVLARLEASSLHPVIDADGYSLLRRASYDLTGLPPTPAQIKSFQLDYRSDPQAAFETVVDQLLASAEFGERWGRHWMDVARYSDTLGGGSNYTLDDAWRYRDYLIDAFNNDLPYNQFVSEQVAGDLLPYDSAAQQERQTIATGFLALGPKDLTDQDKVKLMADAIDEQMDTLGKAFMGLAIGCARCHSHKFDPIPIEDYYSLAGIFRSTQTLEELDDTKKFANMPSWNHIPLPTVTDEERKKIEADYDAKTESLRKQKREVDREIKRLDGTNSEKAANTQTTSTQTLGVKVGDVDSSRLATLQAEVMQLEKRIKSQQTLKQYFGTPTLPTILGVLEGQRIENVRVNLSGNPRQLGHEVPRRTLRAFGSSSAIPDGESGRLQLARWLVDPRHPLTARVMSNRVWSHLMGEGIVASIDNFGTTGTPPSHPELLDYLALRFVEDGWSVKSLIRRIMLSRVYRLASAKNPQAEPIDPGNRLLWKRTTRRLDIESLRDSLLSIGGRLNQVRGGPTLVHTGELSLNYREEIKRDGLWKRRSVYLPVYRNTILEQTAMNGTFDFADPNVVVGHRTSSIVPTQALFLMNNDLTLDCAEAFARQLMEQETEQTGRIQRVYLTVFARPPSDKEIRRALAFIQAVTEQSESASDPEHTAWSSFCQALFSSGEFLLLN